ncbi:MAG TPA: helix-turn-helix domain-containing protein [Beijerinckiaceae bacterium]|nr:helix-turn-helix domain-containing protein [Beijerinckiaceae bacterium]
MLVRTAKDIGLVIREQRRKLNLDQEELARRVKVSRQWVVEVEKGKLRAEIGLVLRTLNALGLALSVAPEPKADAVASVDIDDIIDDLGPDRL